MTRLRSPFQQAQIIRFWSSMVADGRAPRAAHTGGSRSLLMATAGDRVGCALKLRSPRLEKGWWQSTADRKSGVAVGDERCDQRLSVDIAELEDLETGYG